MTKYEFINKLMQMYYDGFNHLKTLFTDMDYYDSLNSEFVTRKLYNSIVEFLKFEYYEAKLDAVLDIKRILFENAISLNDSELYADVLYGIATDNLAWELENIRIEGANT